MVAITPHLSPYTLSTRPQAGQNLDWRTQAAGNAAWPPRQVEMRQQTVSANMKVLASWVCASC